MDLLYSRLVHVLSPLSRPKPKLSYLNLHPTPTSSFNPNPHPVIQPPTHTHHSTSNPHPLTQSPTHTSPKLNLQSKPPHSISIPHSTPTKHTPNLNSIHYPLSQPKPHSTPIPYVLPQSLTPHFLIQPHSHVSFFKPKPYTPSLTSISKPPHSSSHSALSPQHQLHALVT